MAHEFTAKNGLATNVIVEKDSGSGVTVTGNVVPSVDNNYTLGSVSGNKWKNILLSNGLGTGLLSGNGTFKYDGYWQYSNDGVTFYSLGNTSLTYGITPNSVSITNSEGSSLNPARGNHTHAALQTPDGEPVGFENRTDSTISFIDAARQFRIQKVQGSYSVWGGINYKYTNSDGYDYINLTNTVGNHYIYYVFSNNTTAALQEYSNFQGFGINKVFVSIVCWDGYKSIAIDDERHCVVMDWSTHQYLHNTVGTRYDTGLTIQQLANGTGGANGDGEVSITGGIVYDEDIDINIVTPYDSNTLFSQNLGSGTSTPAYIPVFYRTTADAHWTKDTATVYPARPYNGSTPGPGNSVRIGYNLNTAGTWSVADPGSNTYVAMWIFATDSITEPVVAIMGQRFDTTLANAQTNNTYSSLSFGTLPFQEAKVLYRLIFKTNAGYANDINAYIADVQDLRSVSNLPSGTYVATDHGSLAGLTAANQHPASSIYTTTTSWSNILTSNETDVQLALNRLDGYACSTTDSRLHTQNTDISTTNSTFTLLSGDATNKINIKDNGGILEFWKATYDGYVTTRANVFQSIATTGTSPLIVASTTAVTNLNADMVDGYHYTSFVLGTDSRLHTQNTDIGTTSTTFQLNSGSSGVKLKDSTGLSVRNSTDAADANISGANIISSGYLQLANSIKVKDVTTGITVRNAADSGYANIRCARVFTNNANTGGYTAQLNDDATDVQVLAINSGNSVQIGSSNTSIVDTTIYNGITDGTNASSIYLASQKILIYYQIASPEIGQANETRTQAAQNLYIHAQNTAVASQTAGKLQLKSGTGASTAYDNDLELYRGSTLYLSLITGQVLQFATGLTTPTINQALAASGTGAPLKIQAQNVTTGTGGKLQLYSGTGSSADGDLELYRGSTLFLTCTTNSIVSLPQGILSIGANVSTVGTGIRAGNGFQMYGRDSGNTTNISILSVTPANHLGFGDANYANDISGAYISLTSYGGSGITLNPTIGASCVNIGGAAIQQSLRFSNATTTNANISFQNIVSGNGLPFVIYGQATASGTGGKLQLRSGTGTTDDGDLELYRGVTLYMSMSTSGVVKILQNKLNIGPGGVDTTDKTITADGNIDGILKYAASTNNQWQYSNNSGTTFYNIGQEVPYTTSVGFEDRSATTLSWNSGTYTLSLLLAGSNTQFIFWEKNSVRYVKTTTQTSQISSPTAGNWYFYFLNGTLTNSQSLPDAMQSCTVAQVWLDGYSNATLGVWDQRHTTLMPWKIHEWAENTFGMVCTSGLTLSQATSGVGTANTDGYVSVIGGTLYDEDIQIGITTPYSGSTPFSQNLGNGTSTYAQIPVYYRNSSGNDNWRKTTANNLPAVQNGSGHRLVYDGYTAGTGLWAQTEAEADGYYVVYFIVATSSYTTTEPIIAVMGQLSTSDGPTVTNYSWANMNLGNMSALEVRPLYKLIYRTSTAYSNNIKAYISSIQDLRQTNIPVSSAYGFSPTAHSSLSGLNATGSHPASAISVDTTGFALNMSGKTDVQQAMAVVEAGPSWLNNATVQWTTGTTAPTLKQADKTTTGTAQNLIIQAQTNTNVSGTGGSLILSSGGGNTADGDIELWRGGTSDTKYLSLTSTGSNFWNKPVILNSTVETATLGADLITNGAFTDGYTWSYGAGWYYDSGNQDAYALAGSASTLTQTVTFTANSFYLVTFSITTTTVGRIWVTCGGSSNLSASVGTTLSTASMTLVVPTYAVSSTFAINKDSAWAGTIDLVTCKKITVVPSVLSGVDHSGYTNAEVRFGPGNQSSSIQGTDAIGIGRLSLQCYSNTSQDCGITFLGESAGYSLYTGTNNTGIGSYALCFSTTANNNTAVGAFALNNNTIGGYNTAIGAATLKNCSEGTYNTAVGNAAITDCIGDFNTAVGGNAGLALTSGSTNSTVGSLSLGHLTTGSGNTCMGYRAGYTMVSPSYNTAIGYYAMYYFVGTGNTYNTAVGYNALAGANGVTTTGGNNTAIGYSAIAGLTTGIHNACVGDLAGRAIADGQYNCSLGALTLYNTVSGSDNIAIGGQALYTNTGSSNVSIGRDSSYYQVAVSGTVAVGYNANKFGTGSYNTAIGYQALLGVNATTTGQYNVALGYWALKGITIGGNNICVGYNAGTTITTGGSNIALGSSTLQANSTGVNNIAIGGSALVATTSDNNIAIGVFAGYRQTTGAGTVAIGHEAFYYGTGKNNTAIGYLSMMGVDGYSIGTNNTSLGNQALKSFTTGSNNTCLGNAAGTYINTGSGNVAVGSTALQLNNTGQYNIAIGQSALLATSSNGNIGIGFVAAYRQTSNTGTVAVGSQALSFLTGVGNTGVGYQCLYGIDGYSTGTNNVGLGWKTLFAIITASNNTTVGYQAGYNCTTGNNNTYLGYQADGYVSYNNQIAIGYNATAATPNTMVIGSSAAADVVYTVIRGSDDGRCIEMRFRSAPTSTAAVEMFLDTAGTTRYSLVNNTVASFHGTISCINTTSGNAGGWEIKGCIKQNGANNVALVGTPVVTQLGNEDSLTTPAITADTSNQSLKISVVGLNGVTIKYSANIHIAETRF